jgi:leucyl aminopeptidase
MALAELHCHPALSSARLPELGHALMLLPVSDDLPRGMPARAQWLAVLRRRDMKPGELAKTALALDLPDGRRIACAMVDAAAPRFERLTLLRKAVMLLQDETPKAIAICAGGVATSLALDAVYVALLNGAVLPTRKKKPAQALKALHFYGAPTMRDFAPVLALAAANTLTRALTATAPNELTPKAYRKRIRSLGERHDWKVEEYDYRRLKKMGAGAFCAVAQGSGSNDDGDDAAIVHLAYRPKGARRHVALVGKGICFDTGGHNLKPAKYMAGMHEDMNGSAVVLGILQAISQLRLPVAVDAWLAIAHNHLSPQAYKQNDIVTALNGTTIEIVHTDAEGRMVLADALTLAARGEPELIIDFATLTGSMAVALGNRYSGVFASNDTLAAQAVAAGHYSGERVCLFPQDADYEPELDSKVADIKQCTLEGEADHILAARFLRRFGGDAPWLHVDLSASSCKGGLGAVAGDLTGFGVGWGLHLLNQWLTEHA